MKGVNLKELVAREFAKLSSQEVLFFTQVQSTGYEMLASGHPDCFTAYYMILLSDEESVEAKDKVIEELLNWVSDAHGCEQMRHYSNTCWTTRRSWMHFWTKWGTG